MYPYFDVDGISVEKLLAQWRWLCPGDVRLVAVNPFGDLFLEDSHGTIVRLDTSTGRLEHLCNSLGQFQEGTESPEKRREWFVEDVALSLAEHGFRPSKGSCLGYKTPLGFREGTGSAANVYLADLYEYVSFLGDLHGQMKDMLDGGKVKLIIGKRPEEGGRGSRARAGASKLQIPPGFVALACWKDKLQGASLKLSLAKATENRELIL